MTDSGDAIDWNHAAITRFANDDEFVGRVLQAAGMTRRIVELMGLSTCDHNHTLHYRRAAAIGILLAETERT